MFPKIRFQKKPIILAGLGIAILVFGIIAAGTGIGAGSKGKFPFVIAMAVLTGFFALLICMTSSIGGIMNLAPSLMGFLSWMSCIVGLFFTWMAAGSLGFGRNTSLENAFCGFSVIKGLLELVFLFLSVGRSVMDEIDDTITAEHAYVDEPIERA